MMKINKVNRQQNRLAAIFHKGQGESRRQLLLSLFFLFSGLLFLLFLVFFTTHRVSGISMEPTVSEGDRILIQKGVTPLRYDLVTFSPIEKPEESYIKRVIGMPGDIIWLEETKLFINHQMKTTVPIPSHTDKRAIDLPDGTIKVNLTVETAAKLEGMTNIPKNHYFLLGDNRNQSVDSRWLGLISKEAIEGVVKWRYFPLNALGSLR